MRTFIAIEIPEKARREIVKIQKQLPEFDGKMTEPENLHLTLKFLGEIDEKTLNEVKRKLGKIQFEKFNVGIDSLGIFSPSYIKIVWLHLNDCTELHKAIDYSLSGIFPLEKRFMSHLTIARVKNIKNRKKFLNETEKIKIPKINFMIDRLYLKESMLTKEKPIYKNIEAYSLK